MISINPGTLDYKILLAFINIKEDIAKKKAIKPGQLKDLLNISHSTLNSALERMENNGLLKWKHYGSVILEKKGEDALEHVKNHQHLIKLYLMKTLNLNDEESEEESLKLAPHFSCRLIDRLVDKYPKCNLHEKHETYLEQCADMEKTNDKKLEA